MPDKRPNRLTITEVARELNCSRGHVYNLLNAGELKAIDISTGAGVRGMKRIARTDVEGFLRRKRAEAVAS